MSFSVLNEKENIIDMRIHLLTDNAVYRKLLSLSMDTVTKEQPVNRIVNICTPYFPPKCYRPFCPQHL